MKATLFVILISMATIVCTVHVDNQPEYQNCDDLHCVDPILTPNGPCLLKCPQGQTCRNPMDGSVMKAGVLYDTDGIKCQCKTIIAPNWEVADCKFDQSLLNPRWKLSLPFRR